MSKKTSYDKIYDLLLATDECQTLMGAVEKEIKLVKLENVSFTLGYDKPRDAIPKFKLSCGTVWSTGPGELSADSFLTRDMAVGIINECFGPEKKVKTRNCSYSIVRNGGEVATKDRYGHRDMRGQESFHEFLVSQVQDKHSTVIESSHDRLKKEIESLVKTDEYKKSHHEALVSFCKKTITEALLPWNHMDESVLTDAWDQFICAAAMVE